MILRQKRKRFCSYRTKAGQTVRFYLDTDSMEQNRRVAIATTPFSDQASVVDLGLSETSFQVTGYLIGYDYMIRRDELVLALRQPGTLMHPFRGQHEGICQNIKFSERANENRVCFISFKFIKMEPRKSPFEQALEDKKKLMSDDFVSSVAKLIQSDWIGDLTDATDTVMQTLDTRFLPFEPVLAFTHAFQSEMRQIKSIRADITKATAEVMSAVVSAYKSAIRVVKGPENILILSGISESVSQYKSVPPAERALGLAAFAAQSQTPIYQMNPEMKRIAAASVQKSYVRVAEIGDPNITTKAYKMTGQVLAEINAASPPVTKESPGGGLNALNFATQHNLDAEEWIAESSIPDPVFLGHQRYKYRSKES